MGLGSGLARKQFFSEYRYLTFILMLDNERAGYIQFECTSEFIFLSMIVLNKQYQSRGYGPRVLAKIQATKPELPIRLRFLHFAENLWFVKFDGIVE